MKAAIFVKAEFSGDPTLISAHTHFKHDFGPSASSLKSFYVTVLSVPNLKLI